MNLGRRAKNGSRKRSGPQNDPLDLDDEPPRRRRGVISSPACPAAAEEDTFLEGDSKHAQFAEEAHHWQSTPTLSRSVSSESGGPHRHNLQLKTVFMLTSWSGRSASQSPSASEEELLEACEMGDLIKVKKLLSPDTGPPVNVNCVDILGRTPLLIAMERDNIQMMDMLITKSSKRNVDSVLLHSINQCKETIATAILRHPAYVHAHKINLKRLGTNVGMTDGDYPMMSNFYLDTTPIILASQKNLFAVVKLLLLRGELIPRPHPPCCSCVICDRRIKRDRLRYAHRRLNTYRGLASDSYITLASNDPFEEAFDLRQEVITLSNKEKYFKEEYLILARQLGRYLVRLLNEIRGSSELDLVLDKVAGKDDKTFEPLARMRRAIQTGEKKFVTHPSCQMKLTELWYKDAGFLQRMNWMRRLLIFIIFMVTYPFLAIMYVFTPNMKRLRILRSPAIRFTAQAYSFLIFIVAILGWSLNYDPGSSVKFDFRGHNVSHFFRSGKDGYIVREYQLDVFEIAIFVWITGLLWMKCEDIYRRGIVQHFSTIFNALDMVMITLYLNSFCLGLAVVVRCNKSLKHFEDPQKDAFGKLEQLDETALTHFLSMTPDRYLWDPWDPEHFSEAAFAIANVLTFSRISYLLAANEILGPLQISLGRMTYDILRFAVLFMILLIAFIVGIDNLLWHYEDSMRSQVQIRDWGKMSGSEVKVGAHFGNTEKTFRSVFWVTFGLVEYDIIDMDPYKDFITQHLAYILLGAYMVAVGLVMLNMLIAMMSRSFDQIEQDGDIEFKFARSKLYLEYIEGGTPLPVPLNVLPTANTFRDLWDNLLGMSATMRKRDSCEKLPEESKKTSTRHLKKNESKAIFAEVQFASYQDVVKKIVNRFISELTRKEDDDTDKQNTAEMVRREIQCFHEATREFMAEKSPPDTSEVKQCLSQLTTTIDKFIRLQEETSSLLKVLTTKAEGLRR